MAWLSPANASFRLASVLEPFNAGMVVRALSRVCASSGSVVIGSLSSAAPATAGPAAIPCTRSHRPRKTTSALSTSKPGRPAGDTAARGSRPPGRGTLPQLAADEVMVRRSTLGSKRAEPVPTSSAGDLAQLGQVVERLVDGLERDVGHFPADPLVDPLGRGMGDVPSRAAKMHWRWAVILRPLARKRSVNASGDCMAWSP